MIDKMHHCECVNVGYVNVSTSHDDMAVIDIFDWIILDDMHHSKIPIGIVHK